MIDFPDILPQPLLQSYDYKIRDNLYRTETESGYIRLRPRYNDINYTITVKFTLTAEELLLFENFYLNSLNYGVESFNMNLTLYGEEKNHVVRFFKPYSVAALADDIYSVNSSLEILTPTKPNSDIIDILEEDTLNLPAIISISSFTSELDELVDRDLPGVIKW